MGEPLRLSSPVSGTDVKPDRLLAFCSLVQLRDGPPISGCSEKEKANGSRGTDYLLRFLLARVENLSAGQMCTEDGAKSCAPNAGGWISNLVWALYTSGNKEGSEGREDT